MTGNVKLLMNLSLILVGISLNSIRINRASTVLKEHNILIRPGSPAIILPGQKSSRCHVMWVCFAAAPLIFINTHALDDIK